MFQYIAYIRRHNLTDNKIYNSRRQGKSIKKVLCSTVDAQFFNIQFSPECDTCDSKKTTSLLECAYVRVRERCNHFSPVFFSLFIILFTLPSSLLFSLSLLPITSPLPLPSFSPLLSLPFIFSPSVSHNLLLVLSALHAAHPTTLFCNNHITLRAV